MIETAQYLVADCSGKRTNIDISEALDNFMSETEKQFMDDITAFSEMETG